VRLILPACAIAKEWLIFRSLLDAERTQLQARMPFPKARRMSYRVIALYKALGGYQANLSPVLPVFEKPGTHLSLRNKEFVIADSIESVRAAPTINLLTLT